MTARVACQVCGAVRALEPGEAFPHHASLLEATRGRFHWCPVGFDSSRVIVGIEAAHV